MSDKGHKVINMAKEARKEKETKFYELLENGMLFFGEENFKDAFAYFPKKHLQYLRKARAEVKPEGIETDKKIIDYRLIIKPAGVDAAMFSYKLDTERLNMAFEEILEWMERPNQTEGLLGKIDTALEQNIILLEEIIELLKRP